MKTSNRRWIIAGLLLLATAINYADRLALPIVSRGLRTEFRMTEQDYAQVITIFLIAYAIMYAGSGYVVDRLGTRKGFAVFIFLWSVAAALHGVATGKWSLAFYRFLLGLAEPGAWPAAAKAVQEWFPPAERALGMGIFNAGSSIGSAIAPPVVAFLTLHYGWRFAFFFTGAIGFAWMALWLIFYYTPASPEATPAMRASVDWKKVISARGCWTLILARFFTDPVIYFVIFWLPEYLGKERGFNLEMVGRYAWVPFAFGGVGYIIGGWLSGAFMRHGWSLPTARKTAMLVGAVMMPAAIFAPLVPTAFLAIAATCFVTLGHAFWVANLQTLPADLFPGHEVGTCMGLSGMGGAVGGILANLGTGWVVQNFSYAPIFALAGLMHPLSMLLVYWLLPNRCFAKTH